ncbi:hypothetical protein CP970_06230 [Streptomyces kanamyceticus]|uniref:Uncharacterized protein n=1 Tax=Streptomyces kanamyceticus TaxID=1967 RepID=A0A5J6G4I9_STRKN|nr:hypothetical protein CP970_06230 [Streptomyces kanamyceticus]
MVEVKGGVPSSIGRPSFAHRAAGTSRPRKFPIGAAVAVHPGDGHRPEDHWTGVIEEHLFRNNGKPRRLTNVRCTDPRGFLNNRVDHVTTVETRKPRPLNPK